MGIRSWARETFGPAAPSMPGVESRYNLAQYMQETMNYGGLTYPLMTRYPSTPVDEIPNDFPGFAAAMAANPIVFACMALRMRVFSEVRFDFRKFSDLHTTEMIGGFDGRSPANRDLELLRHPWPGGTSGDLLARSEQYGMLAGNAFIYRGERSRLRLLRPDWVSILFSGDPELLSWEIEGYVYHPGGKRSKKEPILLDVKDVAHYVPTPDPMSPWRGMACLSPIVTDIRADNQATAHKLDWFEHGGTGTMVVELNNPALNDPDKFEKVIQDFKTRHRATADAYEVLFMANGADAKVIGSNLQQSDFKAIQGAGEMRIAECFETPAALVGLSEGMSGSSLNAGNYSAQRRRFADGTMRPLWRNYCGSLEQIITTPTDSQLTFDDRDVGFLREDAKDQAEIQSVNATSITNYVKDGFTAKSSVEAILTGDLSVLEHTGLFSVQLQAPGSTKMPQGEVPGEVPVGPGTKPESLPGGAAKPVPASNGNGQMNSALIAAIERRQPDVFHIQPAEVTVNVPPTIVENRFEVPAPQVTVEPAQVTVEPTQVTVEASQITVEAAQVTVPTPQVTVEPRFDVATPDVNVTVEAAKVTVPSPVVNIAAPEPRKTRRKILRDRDQRIVGVEDED